MSIKFRLTCVLSAALFFGLPSFVMAAEPELLSHGD